MYEIDEESPMCIECVNIGDDVYTDESGKIHSKCAECPYNN